MLYGVLFNVNVLGIYIYILQNIPSTIISRQMKLKKLNQMCNRITEPRDNAPQLIEFSY